MNKKWLAVAGVLLVALLFVGVVALLTVRKSVNTHGKIKTVNVSVWQDADYTIPLIEIDWGTINTDTVYSTDINVKSESNVPIGVVLQVENIEPSGGWIIYDEGNSLYLQPNGTGIITFQFYALPEYGVMDFSFDLVVIGTEA